MQVIVYRIRCLARSQWPTALALAVVVAMTGAPVLTLVASARRTTSAPGRYETSYITDADVGIEQQSGPPRHEEIASLPSVESVSMTTFVFGALSPIGQVSDEVVVESLVFAGDLAGFALRLEEGRLRTSRLLGEE